MLVLTLGADMARPSRTGGKKSEAKARNASPAKGRKTTETKPRTAPAAALKRRSVSDPIKDLKEAREQQAATAEILKVIASSPSDVQPVFEAIASSANRLLGGFSTAVFRFLDDTVHLAAFTPVSPAADAALQADFPRPVDAFEAFRLAQQGKPFPIPDTEEIPHVPIKEIARLHGFRSMLFVPLMSNGVPIGVVSITRATTGTFAEHHVQLMQTFADQAVIAIENVRLFNETQEALKHQTATSEVLQVIGRSMTDTQPVFERILDSTERLFDCRQVSIFLAPGDGLLHVAARRGTGYEAIDKVYPLPIEQTSAPRVLGERRQVYLPDVMYGADVPSSIRRVVQVFGNFSVVMTPMIWEGQGIGLISVLREPNAAFTPKELSLLRTFADQAVIAIENVRLFKEVQAKTADLSESLQQQTATADVLKVISRSAFDLQTVLETLVVSAACLCEADEGTIFQPRDDAYRLTASCGLSPPRKVFLENCSFQPGTGSTIGRVLLEGKTVHIEDSQTDQNYRFQDPEVRTRLGVPLLREGAPIGVFVLARRDVRPFSDKQIELVQTFADQAVIAIENVRLFDEVQTKTRDLTEALTYQTESSNILRVIASSPTDVGPVLNAIVESACQLCDAYDAAVVLQDGEYLRISAHHGPIPIGIEKWPINRRWTAGRAFVDQTPVHIEDLSDEKHADFTDGRELSLRMGHRTILSVPLLREGESIGAIVLRRTEVHPFSEKQITLLQTFADQAVIAIGNVRLFQEVQAKTRDLSEALSYQTGSGKILSVIASSPTEVRPVLKAIVETACELCDASDALVFLKDGEDLRFSAHHGSIPIDMEKWPINRNWVMGRTVVDGVPVHVHDLPSEGEEFPEGRELARHQGIRTVLSAPLLREGESIGTIALRRTEVQPFSEKQIALLQTFADQAVIALGNVRLFDEVQAKTRDLTEALQQQLATVDVLKVISSSPGELEPVFQVLLENAVRLCEAQFGVLCTFDLSGFQYVSARGASAEYTKYMQQRGPFRPASGVLDRIMRTKQPSHTADEAAEVVPGPAGTFGGARSLVGVPMLKNGELRGAIIIYRTEVRPFADQQIDLLTNFAAQAVIAIDNTRLLNELRHRTDDLTRSLQDLHSAQERLVQTEKLASLGQLTAGIAHEIKNPLNFVNNFSALSAELTDELNDVLKPAPLDGKMRAEVDELTRLLKDNLEKVVQHGKRADSIVKNMLLHSREGSGEQRPTDINALLDESLNLAYHGARAEKAGFSIAFQRDLDPTVGMADVYPQEITRVLLNLISNGFYAATNRKVEAGDVFEPMLSATTKNLGDKVEIRIRDNGTGIPDDVKEKIFNPFFTTKPAGEGTGLGLSMTHDIIVKQHGGRIDVTTEPGQFTEFIIVLPRKSNVSGRDRG
ncbi:GAF domain-containing protein, partial [Bradyrhizobium sp. JYMT SZCCT0428]|nr:GAF domain-containing protein [Bradyrhizobium sp. JYMT SZCCT0428]